MVEDGSAARAVGVPAKKASAAETIVPVMVRNVLGAFGI
jgi:hypothetical protein